MLSISRRILQAVLDGWVMLLSSRIQEFILQTPFRQIADADFACQSPWFELLEERADWGLIRIHCPLGGAVLRSLRLSVLPPDRVGRPRCLKTFRSRGLPQNDSKEKI